jgi:hypothetical protein
MPGSNIKSIESTEDRGGLQGRGELGQNLLRSAGREDPSMIVRSQSPTNKLFITKNGAYVKPN